MSLGQSMCVVGFQALRVCQLYSHPNHAMGIAGLHMCSELGEYVDSDK